MKMFGAGVLVATGLVDASGNVISTTTPSPFGILQNVQIDFSFQNKPLFGENQFAVAIGRGEGTVSGKATAANIYAALFNNVFFGQSLVNDSAFFATVKDSTGTLIPATPFQITVTPPSSGTWNSDQGVTDSTGRIMQCVASGPAAGQYSVAAGVYTFSSADHSAALTVFINYRYTATVTGSRAGTIANLPMGYAPSVQIDLSVSYAGKLFAWRFPNTISPKMSIQFKNNDWTIPNYEFECFSDNLNNIAYYSMSQ